MMMIWMMGGPLHCLIKPTQVAVVLRRLHVALAKAGSRLRRYKMWRRQRFRWKWLDYCFLWWLIDARRLPGGSITFVLRGPVQKGEVPPPPWEALSLPFGPDQQKLNIYLGHQTSPLKKTMNNHQRVTKFVISQNQNRPDHKTINMWCSFSWLKNVKICYCA